MPDLTLRRAQKVLRYRRVEVSASLRDTSRCINQHISCCCCCCYHCTGHQRRPRRPTDHEQTVASKRRRRDVVHFVARITTSDDSHQPSERVPRLICRSAYVNRLHDAAALSSRVRSHRMTWCRRAAPQQYDACGVNESFRRRQLRRDSPQASAASGPRHRLHETISSMTLSPLH